MKNYNYNQDFFVFQSELRSDIKMNYLFAEPSDRKEGEMLPLIVFLHGAGQRGTDPQLIKVHGIPKMIDEGLPIRAAILAPQVPDSRHVWNTLADETMELILNIRNSKNIDHERVSLTGISMGGYGTWEIATSNHSEFSAIAPICGGGMSWRGSILKNLHIRAIHGDADTVVPVNNTLEMVDNINANGGHAECLILYNVGHDSWGFAYEHTDLIEWLATTKRRNNF